MQAHNIDMYTYTLVLLMHDQGTSLLDWHFLSCGRKAVD